MNWYRIAFKKEAITYQDFFKFYALSAIPNEVFKQNPVFLYEFIEHLNIIREYYLDTLLKEIAEELFHWGGEAVGDYGVPKRRNTIYEENKVTTLRKKFFSKKLTHSDFSLVKEIFQDKEGQTDGSIPYAWDPGYGGEAWALVAEWVEKLYFFDYLEQGEFSEGLITSAKRLAFIIDTINSLEHNTNMVLKDLPNKEQVWMADALEVVKNATHPSQLAHLSEDADLQKLYKKDVLMPYGVQTESPKSITDEFRRNYEADARVFEIAERGALSFADERMFFHSDDVDFIKAGILNGYDLSSNPYIDQYIDEVVLFALKYRKFYCAMRILMIHNDKVRDINKYLPFFKKMSPDLISTFDLLIGYFSDINLNLLEEIYESVGAGGLIEHLKQIPSHHLLYLMAQLITFGNVNLILSIVKKFNGEFLDNVFAMCLEKYNHGNSKYSKIIMDLLYKEYGDWISQRLVEKYKAIGDNSELV